MKTNWTIYKKVLHIAVKYGNMQLPKPNLVC